VTGGGGAAPVSGPALQLVAAGGSTCSSSSTWSLLQRDQAGQQLWQVLHGGGSGLLVAQAGQLCGPSCLAHQRATRQAHLLVRRDATPAVPVAVAQRAAAAHQVLGRWSRACTA
jgi:hypothetical protein